MANSGRVAVGHPVDVATGTLFNTYFDYRLGGLIPLSFVVGAGFLVLCDVIARTVLSPAELPIGVVTAFFGAPFFAVVLRTSGWTAPFSFSCSSSLKSKPSTWRE